MMLQVDFPGRKLLECGVLLLDVLRLGVSPTCETGNADKVFFQVQIIVSYVLFVVYATQPVATSEYCCC